MHKKSSKWNFNNENEHFLPLSTPPEIKKAWKSLARVATHIKSEHRWKYSTFVKILKPKQ